MPFKSEAQRKWMWAKDPVMAKKWAKHTPKGKKLPEHVKKVAELRAKLAVAMAPQTLIPGAPPVNRIQPPGPAAPAGAPAQPGQSQPQPAPAPGQAPAAPAAQPNASGIPQTPTATVPQLPTAKDVAKQPMTAQSVTAAQQAQPQAINNSEAIIANKLSKMGSGDLSSMEKMAALVYAMKLASDFKKLRG